MFIIHSLVNLGVLSALVVNFSVYFERWTFFRSLAAH